MKKVILLCFLLGLLPWFAQAQKIGFVDTEYILKHLPEYLAGQNQIDSLAAQWQEEIELRFKAVEIMETAYQQEVLLLSEYSRKQKLAAIDTAKREAEQQQKELFGYEGKFFKRKSDLIKPLLNKIYKAMEQIAENRAYAIIVDKSSEGFTALYLNKKYDLTDDVIKKLGLVPGKFAE